MKYLKFVFENEEVCNVTDSNEELINIATQAVIYNSVLLENDITNDLDIFLSSSSDLTTVYESIRNYTISKSIEFYDIINEILVDSNLDDKIKILLINEESFFVKNLKDFAGAKADSYSPSLKAANLRISELEDQAKSAGINHVPKANDWLIKNYEHLAAAIKENPGTAAAIAAGTAGLGGIAYGIKRHNSRK